MRTALLVTESSVYTDRKGDFMARGGGEMYFHELAKSLLNIGIKPFVLAIREFDSQLSEEDIDGVNYRRMNVESRTSLKLVSYLRRAVKESEHYDYIFLNQFTPHLILPYLKGKKSFAVIHDLYRDRENFFWIKQYGFLKGLAGTLVERVQHFCDKRYAENLVVNSGQVYERVGRVLGKRALFKTMVNPFVVDFEENMQSFLKDDLILFVGRFVDYKNPAHVLYALKKVKELLPSFKAVFVVSRFDRKVFGRFNLIRDELGLKREDAVMKFDCTNDELKDLYRRSKVLIQPSYTEGQGIVVLEALKYGLPVVAYDLPVYRDVLVNGENSILVKKGDVDGLALRTVHVLQMYSFYKDRVQNSVNRLKNGKQARLRNQFFKSLQG